MLCGNNHIKRSKGQAGNVKKELQTRFSPNADSFIGCVNKTGIDGLAHIKNENVIVKCLEGKRALSKLIYREFSHT